MEDGKDMSDIQMFGTVVAMTLVVAVNLRVSAIWSFIENFVMCAQWI
jgi:hypothetical protein